MPKMKDSEWSKLRRLVLERDHNTCVKCGMNRADLQAHHIRPKGQFGRGAGIDLDVVENLVTLCEMCHAEWGIGWNSCGIGKSDFYHRDRNYDKFLKWLEVPIPAGLLLLQEHMQMAPYRRESLNELWVAEVWGSEEDWEAHLEEVRIHTGSWEHRYYDGDAEVFEEGGGTPPQ